MEPKLPADCEYHLTQLFQTPELRTEIRAYLRHRLFTSIQNSALGPCLARKDVQPVSPKLQTLNLLVAEYLLQHRHHFTLSVFSCEVPSVSCLSPSLQDTLMGRTTSSAVPFCEEDLNDMLNTLGISPNCSKGQELSLRYSKKNQPLLECLIRSLPELRTPAAIPVQLRDQSCNTDKEHFNLDFEATAKQAQCNAVQELERFHAEELTCERKKWTSELLEQEQQFQQLAARHKEEEHRLRELVNSLQEQLGKAEITITKMRADKVTNSKKVEDQKRELETGQEAIEQKLHLRQIKLSEEAHRLEREKLGLKKIKKKLQLKQRQLDEVALALAHSQSEAKEQPDPALLPALEIQLQIKEHEVSEVKAEAQRLREENQMLRSMTEQQRLRIDNMNVRMAELVSELHHTRESMAEISMPRWPSHHSKHRSSSSSDGSPTDDIVRDAKRRIKTLEEEFEAIGRYHKNFQVRHFNESLISSVLGSSSGQIFAPQPSPVHYQTGWNAEHHSAYNPQESSYYSRYDPLPIPKVPKPQSPRQRVSVPKEIPKLVIELPNPKSSENLTHTLPSTEINLPLRVNKNTAATNVDVSKPTDLVETANPNKPDNDPFIDTTNPPDNDPSSGTTNPPIGPMGDVQLTTPKPNSPIHFEIENDIIQTDNLTTSENVNSDNLNGNPETRVTNNADWEQSAHSIDEKVEALQPVSLQLISDYKLVDPQVSTSSSSKHISAGLPSPAVEEDDFWNM